MHLTQTAPRRWPAVALLGVMLLLQGVEAGGQTNGRTPGTVVSWGLPMLPYVQPLTRFKAIAAGGSHNLALKSDGTVVAWGPNSFGEATAPSGLSNVVAIAAGDEYSLALQEDGTVVAWGEWLFFYEGDSSPNLLPVTVLSGLSGVVAIAGGGDHSLAIVGPPSQPILLAASLDSDGTPVVQLTGAPGYNYLLQFSTNLTDWSPAAVLANTNGTVRFSDLAVMNFSQRFYRALLAP
jgi:hypothetical protein